MTGNALGEQRVNRKIGKLLDTLECETKSTNRIVKAIHISHSLVGVFGECGSARLPERVLHRFRTSVTNGHRTTTSLRAGPESGKQLSAVGVRRRRRLTTAGHRTDGTRWRWRRRRLRRRRHSRGWIREGGSVIFRRTFAGHVAGPTALTVRPFLRRANEKTERQRTRRILYFVIIHLLLLLMCSINPRTRCACAGLTVLWIL